MIIRNYETALRCAVLLIFILCLLSNGCGSSGRYPDEDGIKNEYGYLNIYANYTNVNNTPKLTIDTKSLPFQVKLPTVLSTVGSNCLPSRVCLSINNVRFKDAKGFYEVVGVRTEELRGNDWRVDSENELKVLKSQRLQFVLVLDISSSLGSDIHLIKKYASDFISQAFYGTDNAKIGVVVFSQDIVAKDFGNDYASAQSFISNQTLGEGATKLYEAMSQGVDLFLDKDSIDRVLVTFTDGRNNAWSNAQLYSSPKYIKDKLKKKYGSDKGKISSFTIGLGGVEGAEEEILKQLSLNNGLSEVADNAITLEKIFNKFAASISTVYTMTYDRNNSPIPVSSPIKLRFRVSVKRQ